MARAPWAAHFGFTKLPFPRASPLRTMLDRPHQKALARIRFCIAESLLGVIAGEWASIRPSPCGPPSARWTVPPATLYTWPIRRSAPHVGIVSKSREGLRQVVAKRSAMSGLPLSEAMKN